VTWFCLPDECKASYYFSTQIGVETVPSYPSILVGKLTTEEKGCWQALPEINSPPTTRLHGVTFFEAHRRDRTESNPVLCSTFKPTSKQCFASHKFSLLLRDLDYCPGRFLAQNVSLFVAVTVSPTVSPYWFSFELFRALMRPSLSKGYLDKYWPVYGFQKFCNKEVLFNDLSFELSVTSNKSINPKNNSIVRR
jgi:hypothetical protein